MNLEEITQETFLEKLRRKTRKLVLPLALTSSIFISKCDCNSPTEPKKPKQEIVQLDSLITTTKTNEEGIVKIQDLETEEISTLKIADKETQLPLQNINIACYNNKEENIQVALAQDSLGVYFSNIAYFYPNIAKIAEMPNYYRMLLEKDLSKPFIHFELEIPEYMPKRDKTFLGTTTLRDLHEFYEEHDTLFNNADILEFYFTVLGVKNHPAAVFATRLNEARSKFIENMATFTDMMNIILGGDGQDPDAWYWDVYKSNIAGFGVVQHETNNKGLCTLKGKVIDKNTRKPLDALITIDSKKDMPDDNGDYMITFIPEGSYTITCLKKGYKTASLDTLIKAAKFPSFVSTRKDFELSQIDTLYTFIQPGIEDGKDAHVFYVVLDGFDDINNSNSNEEELLIASWSYVSAHTYIQFDLEQKIPKDITITKAILNFYSPIKWYEGNNFLRVERVLNSWEEDTISYNNRPPSERSNIINEMKELEDSWFSYYLNITDYVKGWVAEPKTNYGLKVWASSYENRSLEVPSSESNDTIHRPKLEIFYYK